MLEILILLYRMQIDDILSCCPQSKDVRVYSTSMISVVWNFTYKWQVKILNDYLE